METQKKYLSFVEAALLSITLVVVAFTLKVIFPTIYENPLSYAVSKFLIFSAIIIVVVKLRKLDSSYLFPKEQYNGSKLWGFVFVTLSMFLFQRMLADSIDIISSNAEDFITKRPRLYEFNSRSIKLFLSLVIVGPIMEELMFRGLIFKSFLKHYSPLKSILLSAALFAILHISLDKYLIPSLVFSFVFASFLAWVVLKTGNIKITIGCHMLWNFSSYILLPFIFMTLRIRITTLSDIIVTFVMMSIVAGLMLYFAINNIRHSLKIK